MNSRTKVIHIEGIVGLMEMSIDLPDELKSDPTFAVRGLALVAHPHPCLLYTSPSPRDYAASRMPSSA